MTPGWGHVPLGGGWGKTQDTLETLYLCPHCLCYFSIFGKNSESAFTNGSTRTVPSIPGAQPSLTLSGHALIRFPIYPTADTFHVFGCDINGVIKVSSILNLKARFKISIFSLRIIRSCLLNNTTCFKCGNLQPKGNIFMEDWSWQLLQKVVSDERWNIGDRDFPYRI